jgi:hypothetical protein
MAPTDDKFLVNAFAQALDIGSVNQELGTILCQHVQRFFVHLHVRQCLPLVHGNDPLRSNLLATHVNHEPILANGRREFL